jgi:hypothetical protein
MTDLPIPLSAGQPCRGLDGSHAPAGIPRRSVVIPLTRHPDLQLYAEEAPAGVACISHMPLMLSGDSLLHPLFIACEFRRSPEVPFAANTPRWSFYYDEASGEFQYKPIRLSPTDSGRIYEAFKTGLVELPREVGRPPFDFPAYIDALHRAFDEIRRQHGPGGKRPTHGEYAAKLGILYDTSKSRFTEAGTSWRKETVNW